MCPKTMVAGRDTETGVEVIDDGPHGGLELERHPIGGESGCKVSHIMSFDFFFGRARPWHKSGDRWTHNPNKGTKMMKVTFSQLTCLYQFLSVMGCSVM